ncbi:aminopeptidase [Oscillospiraceae bacterium OttesenSCG-928-F05]|nr:aminopeptidase [Oscillospiraceae bacterium OttesenSCG-928-F05]
MVEKKMSPRREALLEKQIHAADRLSPEQKDACALFCEAYKRFINSGKTERLAVAEAVALAEAKGFRPYGRGDALKPGDKVYRINRDKALMLAVIGRAGMADGANILAAHVDVPRIDLKTTPLYEDSELAFFKTHYYGGIKKFQWVAIPLALHGVIVLNTGETKTVSIGENPEDPVFTITDILPHLGQEQAKKTLSEAITGEGLNVLIGSLPEPEDEGENRVKLLVLGLLNEYYGVTEADLHSAELSLVPALPARDVGFDRSMIGAYGHDDRVCAYGALRALMDCGTPERTAVAALMDKEEIGSEGVTGMQSAFFDTFMEDLCEVFHTPLRACYEKSFCFSADVTAAFDPHFAEVYDKRNAPKLNYGIGICKYTGSRGKSGASDASAELLGRMRGILDRAGIPWQMAPMGKVDVGGGGTVAMYMANRNIDTLDAGVPTLSMHAPFEIVSKFDTYVTYLAMRAVLEH